MQTIITKVRDLVQDNYKSTSDVFSYLTSKVFTLSESSIDSNSLIAYKNGALFAGSGTYSYNSNTGKITVSAPLVVGDILEFDYNAYTKYSDNEIRGYIRSALTYLATEKYEVFMAKSDNEIFPTPVEGEEYMIALIAQVLMKGGVREYKTPEINIIFNEKETMDESITRIIRQFKKTFGTIKFIKTDRDVKIDKEDE